MCLSTCLSVGLLLKSGRLTCWNQGINAYIHAYIHVSLYMYTYTEAQFITPLHKYTLMWPGPYTYQLCSCVNVSTYVHVHVIDKSCILHLTILKCKWKRLDMDTWTCTLMYMHWKHIHLAYICTYIRVHVPGFHNGSLMPWGTTRYCSEKSVSLYQQQTWIWRVTTALTTSQSLCKNRLHAYIENNKN